MTRLDPDLIEARAIVTATLDPASHARCGCKAEINAGLWDLGHKVRAALAGIKRGRALARTCECLVCSSDMRGLHPCAMEDVQR
jgi:hypothetical protein